jgi:cytochrome P450
VSGLPATGFDAVTGFAEPLATLASCAFLGIPARDAISIRTAAIALLRYLGAPDIDDRGLADAAAAVDRLDSYLDGLLADPPVGEPSLAALRALASVDRGLAVAMFTQLLTGGMDPVGACLATTIRELFRPEHRDLVRFAATADSGPIVEEALRFDAPFHFAARRATRRLVIGDREVPAGSRVLLGLAAANRDPLRYADPDAFVVHRPGPKHLSFGRFGHYCPGAGVARIVLAEGVRAIARRFAGSASVVTRCATAAQPGARVWREVTITE